MERVLAIDTHVGDATCDEDEVRTHDTLLGDPIAIRKHDPLANREQPLELHPAERRKGGDVQHLLLRTELNGQALTYKLDRHRQIDANKEDGPSERNPERLLLQPMESDEASVATHEE